jgi:hypothetical protein
MSELCGRLIKPLWIFFFMLGICWLPRTITAQELDAARLQLRIDGERIGVERYRVWQAGDAINAMGNVVRAQGEEWQIFLQMDTDLRPVKYQVREGRTSVVSGERFADRVRFHIVSDDGERWKEFRDDGVDAIVENGVAHHYLVLLRILENAHGAGVTMVIPSRGEAAIATLLGKSPERVLVGDGAIAATRYDLDINGSLRNVWLDSEGKLLRILDEDKGLEALRLPTQDSAQSVTNCGDPAGTWRKTDSLPKFESTWLTGHLDQREAHPRSSTSSRSER